MKWYDIIEGGEKCFRIRWRASRLLIWTLETSPCEDGSQCDTWSNARLIWRRGGEGIELVPSSSGGSGKWKVERERLLRQTHLPIYPYSCAFIHCFISIFQRQYSLYHRLSKVVANGLEYNQSKCKPTKEKKRKRKDSQAKAIAWFLWLTREDSLSSTSSPIP